MSALIESISVLADQGLHNPASRHYLAAIKEVVRAAVPQGLQQSTDKEGIGAAFKMLLPAFDCRQHAAIPNALSFFLISYSRQDAFKFFFELVTRFVVPGKKLLCELFFATDFQFSGFFDEVLTAAELVVRVDSPADLQSILKRKPFLSSQIRIGLASTYHAIRILETKGLAIDDKTVMLQDSITSLVRRGSKRFDGELISEMQQLLITTSDTFRTSRSFHTLSRIICLAYLFKKWIGEKLSKQEGKRHCVIKTMRSQLKRGDKQQTVTAVLCGLNLIDPHEVFEQSHLIRAVQLVVPEARPIEGSMISIFTGRSDVKLFYIEFVKEKESTLNVTDVRRIRKLLQPLVVDQVEHLLHPIFMPRNEEELIRNIVTLSNQLKFVRDIPQVIISFDEHTSNDLSFTIILLRLLCDKEEKSLEEMFAANPGAATFVADRVKPAGMLRKRYRKEANVFHLTTPKAPFMRQDRSIDLYRARQFIVQELGRVVGPVRDYNGGMLSKQIEAYDALKVLLGPMSTSKEMMLENFFYAVYPDVMRSLLEPKELKRWFHLFLDAMEDSATFDGTVQIKEMEDEEGSCLILSSKDAEKIRYIKSNLNEVKFPSGSWACAFLKQQGVHNLALMLRGRDAEAKELFRGSVATLLTNC